ncbi:unnamed protein product [Dovyalis caffra]|uniref:Uncharacterized protein n=1 Tax=Dovyalis caffra TaxID=77055 RepID=A0AAV1RR54_9ROSI|nr:unnamed protein product [Dovyalis caffra]
MPEKYVRKGRLDRPNDATSRESIKAVVKLPHLRTTLITLLEISLISCKVSLDTATVNRLAARATLGHPLQGIMT